MCFCCRRGFFSIPLSIMFFIMNSNHLSTWRNRVIFKNQKKVRKITLANTPYISLDWAWIMQFGTNKVIYSPTFLNNYFIMIYHFSICFMFRIMSYHVMVYFMSCHMTYLIELCRKYDFKDM